MIVLGDGLVGAPSYWRYDIQYPERGDEAWIVGPVEEFSSYFGDLSDPGGNIEFTYAFDDLVVRSVVVWDDFDNGLSGWWVYPEGGVLRIYRDETPDRTFADPNSFRDGELLLEAEISNMSFGSSRHQADLEFTGGTLFSLVSSGGVGFTGRNPGSYETLPGNDPLPAFYVARSSSIVEIDLPIQTTSGTWGRLRKLYR